MERRKHTRYKSRGLGFVALHNDHGHILGQLLDISQNGLSLRYLAENNIPENFKESCKLDVFSSDQEIALENVSSELVYDSDVESGNIATKRCALQFKDLTDDQQHSLGQYLSKRFEQGKHQGG
jgi:c-di-GMP-binding flagellar brake protein YcgR